MEAIYEILSDAFIGFIILILASAATVTLNAVRERFLTKSKLDQLYELENLANTFIKSAEQKFKLAEELGMNLVTEEQKNNYLHFKRQTNKQRYDYVMKLLQEKYPTLDVKILDAVLEGVYNEYKTYKETRDK